MQNSRGVFASIFLVLCLGWLSPAGEAQENKRWIEIPNEEIPLYQVVDSFFGRLDYMLSPESSQRLYQLQLRDMGIEQGSLEELVLKESTEAARQYLHLKTIDPSIKDEREFIKFQHRALREKVQGLAQILAEMVVALDSLGYPESRFFDYLENRVRPGITFAHNGQPHDLEALRINARFDAQLQNSLHQARRETGEQ